MLDRINDLLDCLIAKTQSGELNWYSSNFYPKEYKNIYAGVFYESSGTYEISRFMDDMNNVTLTLLQECSIKFSTINIPLIKIQEKLFRLFLEVYWHCNGYYPSTVVKLDELILKS